MQKLRKSQRVFKYLGKKINLKQECDSRGLNYPPIYQRIISGKMTVEEALNTPIRKSFKFEYKGRFYSLRRLCTLKGWDYYYISNRIYTNKLSLHQAIESYLKKSDLFENKNDNSKKKAKDESRVKISQEAFNEFMQRYRDIMSKEGAQCHLQ